MNYPVQTLGGIKDIFSSIDWGSVFGGLPATATAQGLAAAFMPITGSKPAVTNYGDYAEITFTPDQEERLAAWILMQLNKEPGPVRVDLGGVALKVVTRKYWPYAVGILGLGLAAGYAIKGR